jgi:hypothetical protein
MLASPLEQKGFLVPELKHENKNSSEHSKMPKKEEKKSQP